MIPGCWSGRAALAPLGWEKPARQGEAPLCDARQPPRPTEEKQDTAEEPLAGCSAMGCLEMLSVVSACPAAWLCHSRGQETPTPLSSPDCEGLSIPAPNWCCSWQQGWDVRAGGSILHPRCRRAAWPRCTRSWRSSLHPSTSVWHIPGSCGSWCRGAGWGEPSRKGQSHRVPSAPLHHSTDHHSGCTWALNNTQGSCQP